jgi:hypothetical protein
MKYLKSYLKNDTKTIKAVEELMKSSSEEAAYRIIMDLKDDPAVNLEKIQTVLLCQKRDFSLSSGLMAVLIAFMAMLFPMLPGFPTEQLPSYGEIIITIVIVFAFLKVFGILDRFQHSEYNKKIDYIVWLIERSK